MRDSYLFVTGLILFSSLSSNGHKSEPLIGGVVPPIWKHPEMARYIAHHADFGTLGTISSRSPTVGKPFSNFFSVVDGPMNNSSGIPYIYLTDLEVSAQDLNVNNEASLCMSMETISNYCTKLKIDPQDPRCAHLILNGKIVKVKPDSPEDKFAKAGLFSRHPEMKWWNYQHKFYVTKMEITDILLLSGFGGMINIPLKDYFAVKINSTQIVN